jgi:predicted nuclease of predicted toxin-antitoxin system
MLPGPSVFQVRTQDILPESIGTIAITAFEQHRAELETGALVVVDPARSRVRILPI